MRLTNTRKAPVTVACPGLLRGADIKGDVGATREVPFPVPNAPWQLVSPPPHSVIGSTSPYGWFNVNVDCCRVPRQERGLQPQIRRKTIGDKAGSTRHGANTLTPTAEAAALSFSSSVASGRPRRKASSR